MYNIPQHIRNKECIKSFFQFVEVGGFIPNWALVKKQISRYKEKTRNCNSGKDIRKSYSKQIPIINTWQRRNIAYIHKIGYFANTGTMNKNNHYNEWEPKPIKVCDCSVSQSSLLLIMYMIFILIKTFYTSQFFYMITKGKIPHRYILQYWELSDSVDYYG